MPRVAFEPKGNHWYVGFLLDADDDVLQVDHDHETNKPKAFQTYEAALAYAHKEAEECGEGQHFVFFNPTVIRFEKASVQENHFGACDNYPRP